MAEAGKLLQHYPTEFEIDKQCDERLWQRAVETKDVDKTIEEIKKELKKYNLYVKGRVTVKAMTQYLQKNSIEIPKKAKHENFKQIIHNYIQTRTVVPTSLNGSLVIDM